MKEFISSTFSIFKMIIDVPKFLPKEHVNTSLASGDLEPTERLRIPMHCMRLRIVVPVGISALPEGAPSLLLLKTSDPNTSPSFRAVDCSVAEAHTDAGECACRRGRGWLWPEGDLG